jgi:hypothetical protein
MERKCNAWYGMSWKSKAWKGITMNDIARHGKARHGLVLDVVLVSMKGYFWRRSMQGGKEERVREEGEACMQGRPNNTRVRIFVMYCNGW